MAQNYELTKYQKIFKDTYWGTFETYVGYPLPEIVSNRNAFIQTHNIVAQKKPHAAFYRIMREGNYTQLMDHCESYEDDKGRLVHVYSKHPNGLVPVPFYERIPPIYALDQHTMIRKYETAKSKRLAK